MTDESVSQPLPSDPGAAELNAPTFESVSIHHHVSGLDPAPMTDGIQIRCFGEGVYDIIAGEQHTALVFQKQPGAPLNGLTMEALLAVVADRLQRFQSGAHACVENSSAMQHVFNAIERLHARTKRRAAEGKLGTSEPESLPR